jgi:hypothetical protein
MAMAGKRQGRRGHGHGRREAEATMVAPHLPPPPFAMDTDVGFLHGIGRPSSRRPLLHLDARGSSSSSGRSIGGEAWELDWLSSRGGEVHLQHQAGALGSSAEQGPTAVSLPLSLRLERWRRPDPTAVVLPRC